MTDRFILRLGTRQFRSCSYHFVVVGGCYLLRRHSEPWVEMSHPMQRKMILHRTNQSMSVETIHPRHISEELTGSEGILDMAMVSGFSESFERCEWLCGCPFN
jgi:hypothetical protein